MKFLDKQLRTVMYSNKLFNNKEGRRRMIRYHAVSSFIHNGMLCRSRSDHSSLTTNHYLLFLCMFSLINPSVWLILMKILWWPEINEWSSLHLLLLPSLLSLSPRPHHRYQSVHPLHLPLPSPTCSNVTSRK